MTMAFNSTIQINDYHMDDITVYFYTRGVVPASKHYVMGKPVEATRSR